MKAKIISRLLIVFMCFGFLTFDCYGQDNMKLKSIEEQNHSIKMVGDSIVVGERLIWGNMKTNYFENGKIYSTEFFNKQGILTSKSIYNYDNKGSKSYMISFNPSGIQVDSIKINYDIDGCEINNLCFNQQGELYRKFEFICNSENKKIQEDWFTSSGEKEMTMRYKYDSSGFVNEIISIDYFNHRYDSTIYVNDKFGNTIESKSFKKNGKLDSVTKYDYKFDNYGNWYERLRNYDNYSLSITRRKIKYYD